MFVKLEAISNYAAMYSSCKRCLAQAVGVPSLVVAIPEGGHVPIFEGGLIRSV